MSEQSPEVELYGATAQLYISDLDQTLVAQIDTLGVPSGARIRVNINDGPIWDADPEHHQHTECSCATRIYETGKHAALPQPIPALAHTSLQPQGENQ